MYAESVPSHEGVFRDRDLAPQESGFKGYSVDQLGDGWVESEEFVEDGG